MFFTTGKLRVLCVGGHPDDIELGCAGFVHRLVRECAAAVKFLILSPGLSHSSGSRRLDVTTRRREAVEGARVLGATGSEDVEVLGFEDCRFEHNHHLLIAEIERRLFDSQGRRIVDLILTHAAGDTHQDHRETFHATVSAARAFDGVILLYQSPSTNPNEFRPTFFVTLDDDALLMKKKALEQHVSQRDKDFMSPERMVEMARSWAVFHRMSDKLLEAYEVYRSCWDVTK